MHIQEKNRNISHTRIVATDRIFPSDVDLSLDNFDSNIAGGAQARPTDIVFSDSPASRRTRKQQKAPIKIQAKRQQQRDKYVRKYKRRHKDAAPEQIEAAADKYMDKKRRKARRPIGPILLMLFGMMLLIFPIVTDLYASYLADHAITSYTQEIEAMSQQDKDLMIAQAITYNHRVASVYDPSDADISQLGYYNILNTAVGGIMGSITIDCIGVNQPIYHGTDDSVLMNGAGHLEGSSFPLRTGKSHSAIAGHTGMPGQRMFDEVKTLVAGDLVKVSILDCTTVYEVQYSEVVDPNWQNVFSAKQGEDLLTLITCTPYGINDHRLLVHCKAVDEEQQREIENNPPADDKLSKFLNMRTLPIIITVAILLFSAIIGAIKTVRKKKKQKKGSSKVQKSEESRPRESV